MLLAHDQTVGGMHAVVTGATGFLGSALVRKLLAEGGGVAALVRPGSPNLARLPSHPRLRLVECDLHALPTCSGPLADFAPEVFYHLGWIGVGNAHRYDLEQYDNPRQVIDAIKLAAQVGCHRWVGTGSQAEYGPANRRLDEQAPLRPTTLYGAAKVASWALGQILGERLGLRMVWARVFSTYGPGDAAGWMLTDVIGTLLRGGCPALTQGVQLWDYLHVDDAAEALYRLGAAPCAEGVYNLGSGQARTIRSIVETVRDLIDPTLPLGFGEVPYRPDQVMHLEADVTRLRRDVGWEPRVDLETGLADLIASLRAPSGERP